MALLGRPIPVGLILYPDDIKYCLNETVNVILNKIYCLLIIFRNVSKSYRILSEVPSSNINDKISNNKSTQNLPMDCTSTKRFNPSLDGHRFAIDSLNLCYSSSTFHTPVEHVGNIITCVLTPRPWRSSLHGLLMV